MPTLLLLLPDGPAAEGFDAWDWQLVDAQGQPLGQGRDATAALPAADNLVLLLGTRAVSWLRTTLPRTPAKRWRAALAGLLEEQLLDDPEHLHLALPAKAQAGDAVWVAATPLAPLAKASAALQAANRFVDRIAPTAWPLEGEAGAGHFLADGERTQLVWRDAEGATVLPLAGDFARARLPAERLASASWTAEPAAVQAAEAWLDGSAKVAVRSRAAQAAQALTSAWDLRQFELAPRIHGLQRAKLMWHRFMQPEWRALRIGLAALLGLQLLGLNLLALQQHRAERAKQSAIEALFRSGFPNNAAVQDAAAQLPRELARLRANAGQPGPRDLDPLLAAAARHWPAGVAPLQALDYQAGSLTLSATDWGDEQAEPFRQAVAANGIRATRDGARIVLQVP
jgi:general secretion pathway protein L